MSVKCFYDAQLSEQIHTHFTLEVLPQAFPGGSVVKNTPPNSGDVRDKDSTSGSRRSPGVGNCPLQDSCLKSSMDRRAQRAIVHGAAKSWTQLSTNTQSSPNLLTADVTSSRPRSNTSPFSRHSLLAWGWVQCYTYIIDSSQACQAFWLCACKRERQRERESRQKAWTWIALLTARSSLSLRTCSACFPRAPLTVAVKQWRVEVTLNSSGHIWSKMLKSLITRFQSPVQHCPSHTLMALPHLDTVWRLPVLISLSRPCPPTASCFPLMLPGPLGRPSHLQLCSD